MKKLFLFSCLLSLTFILSETTQAQSVLNKFGKKLKDKIENKVEDRVDQKVDEKVDEKLDEVFENDSAEEEASDEARQQERMNKFMNGLGMTGEPVPISDSYSFDSKVQMHIESYKSNGDKESDGDFITYMSPSIKNFAYEFISGEMAKKGKGCFIMDLENKAMIILSDENGKKTGLVYGFDVNTLNELNKEEYQDLDNESVENINMNPYLTKTGRTKSIEGYECEEYKYDNPEEKTEAQFWISKEVNFATRDLMSTVFKSATYSSGMPWGFVMESEALDKKTNERTLMKVTDIDNNANKKFDLSGYQVTNLGSMKIPNMDSE